MEESDGCSQPFAISQSGCWVEARSAKRDLDEMIARDALILTPAEVVEVHAIEVPDRGGNIVAVVIDGPQHRLWFGDRR